MVIKSDREKIREEIEYALYSEHCSHCPNARKCHEECENCEGFDNELYKQYQKHNVNEEWEVPFLDESEAKYIGY